MPIGLLRDPNISSSGRKTSSEDDTTSRQKPLSLDHTAATGNGLRSAASEEDARQLPVPWLSPSSLTLGILRVSESSTAGYSDDGPASCADDMCSVGLLSNSRTTSVGGSSLSGAGRSIGGSSLYGLASFSHGGAHCSSLGGASSYNADGCSSGGGFPPAPRLRLPPHAGGGTALKDYVLPRVSTLGAVAEQLDVCASPDGDRGDDPQPPTPSLAGGGAGAGSEQDERAAQLSPSFGLVASLRASWEPLSRETGAGERSTQDAATDAGGDDNTALAVPPTLNSSRGCGDGNDGTDACTPQLLPDPSTTAGCSPSYYGHAAAAIHDDDALPQLETPGGVGAIVALFDDAIRRSVGTGASLRTSANSVAAAAAATPPSLHQEQSPVLAGSCGRAQLRPPRLRVGNSSSGGLRTTGTASTTPPPGPLSHGRATTVPSADASARRLTLSQPAPDCASGGVAANGGGGGGAPTTGRPGALSRATNVLPVSTSSRPHTRSAGAHPVASTQQQPKRGGGGVAPRTSAGTLSQAPVRPPFNLYGKPAAARVAAASAPGDGRAAAVCSPAESQAASPSVSSELVTGAASAAARRPGARPTRPGAQVPSNAGASAAMPTPAPGQLPAGTRILTPQATTTTTSTSSRINSAITALTSTPPSASAASGPQRPGVSGRNSRLLRAPGNNPVAASTPLSPSGKKVANTAANPSAAGRTAVAAAAAVAAANVPPGGGKPHGLFRRPVCRYSLESVCSDGIPSARQILSAAVAATSLTDGPSYPAAASPLRRPEQRLPAWQARASASPMPTALQHSTADTLPLLRSPCCPSPVLFSPGQALPPPPSQLNGGGIMDDVMPMASPIPAAFSGGGDAAADPEGPSEARRRRRPPSDGGGWPWPLSESPRLSDAEEPQPQPHGGAVRSAKRLAALAAAARARSGGGSDAGSDGGDDFGLPAWAWGSVATLLSQSVEVSGLRQSSQLPTAPPVDSQPQLTEAADGPPELLGYAQHDPSLVPLRRLSGTPHRRRIPNGGGQRLPASGAGFRLASGELAGRPRFHRRPTSPGEEELDAKGTAVLLARQVAPRGRYDGSEGRVITIVDGAAAAAPWALPSSSQHSSDSEAPSEPLLPLPAPDDDGAVGFWHDDEEGDDAGDDESAPPAAGARLLPSLSGSRIDAMVFASLHLSGAGPPPTRPEELSAAVALPDVVNVHVDAYDDDIHNGGGLQAAGTHLTSTQQPHRDADNATAATPTGARLACWQAHPCGSSPSGAAVAAVAGPSDEVSWGSSGGESPLQPRGSLSEPARGQGLAQLYRRRPSVERLNCKLARVLEGLRAVAGASSSGGYDELDPMGLGSADVAPALQPSPATAPTEAASTVDEEQAGELPPLTLSTAPVPPQAAAAAAAAAALASPEAGAGSRMATVELAEIVTIMGAAEALLSSGVALAPTPGHHHAWRRRCSSAGGAVPQSSSILDASPANSAALPGAAAWGAVWAAALCAAGVMAAVVVSSSSPPFESASVFAVAGMAVAVLLAAKAGSHRRPRHSERISVSGLGASSGLGPIQGPAAAAATAPQLGTYASKGSKFVTQEPISDTSCQEHAAADAGAAAGEGATRVARASVTAMVDDGCAAAAATVAAESSRAGMVGIAAEAAETCRDALAAMRAAGADRASLRRLARACGAFAGMQIAAGAAGGSAGGAAPPPDVDPADWSLVQTAVRQRLGRNHQPPAAASPAAANLSVSVFQSPVSAVTAASVASPLSAAASAARQGPTPDLAPPVPGVSPTAWRFTPRADGTPSTSPQATVRRELLALVSKAAGADETVVARGSAAIAAAVAELTRSRATTGRPEDEVEAAVVTAAAASAAGTEQQRRERELATAAAEAAAVALVAARKSIGEQGALEETLAAAAGAQALLAVNGGSGGCSASIMGAVASPGPRTARSSRVLLPSESSALEVLVQECRTRHAAYARAAATCSSISALAAVAETAALEALAARREEAMAVHAAALAADARLRICSTEANDAAILGLLKERDELVSGCFAVEAADATAALRAAMAEADALAVLAAGREQRLQAVSGAAAADAALAVRAGAASVRAVLALWSRRQHLLGGVARVAAAGAALAVGAADGEEVALQALVAGRRRVMSLVLAAAGTQAVVAVSGSAASAASIRGLVWARSQRLQAVSDAAAVDSALAVVAADREEAACRACAEAQMANVLACVAAQAGSSAATAMTGAHGEDAALARLAKARVVLAGVCFAVEARAAATSLSACAGEEAAVKALARRRLRCRAAYAAATAAAAVTKVAAAAGEDAAQEQLVARRQADLSEYASTAAEAAWASAPAAYAEEEAQERMAQARSTELASYAADTAVGAAAAVEALAHEEEAWLEVARRAGGRPCLVDAAVGTSSEDLECGGSVATGSGQAVQVYALALLEIQKQRLSLYATLLGTSLGALVAAATASGRCGQGNAAVEAAWPYLAPMVRGFPLSSLGGASVESSADDEAAEDSGQVSLAPASFPLVMQGEASEVRSGNVGGDAEVVSNGARQGDGTSRSKGQGRPRRGKAGARGAVVVRSFGLQRLQAPSRT